VVGNNLESIVVHIDSSEKVLNICISDILVAEEEHFYQQLREFLEIVDSRNWSSEHANGVDQVSAQCQWIATQVRHEIVAIQAQSVDGIDLFPAIARVARLHSDVNVAA
jgi:hypothetical protein